MKVVIINKSDSTGGAAVVSRRLMEAMRIDGIDAKMLVCEKLSDSPYVEVAAKSALIRKNFLIERLKIFRADGFDRKNLFKIDTAECGLPLWRHHLVRDADAILINWVNQGMLSLKGFKEILKLGKPVLWTMHDMWCLTGICHHAGTCTHYKENCKDCPLLAKPLALKSLSHKIWKRKNKIYANPILNNKLAFVAVSHWLKNKASESSLLGRQRIAVIPNAFKCQEPEGHRSQPRDKIRILFGAARLDDPIKGLDILRLASAKLRQNNPKIADSLELALFGNVKNPAQLSGFQLPLIYLGVLKGDNNVARAYKDSQILVSASSYETLPGTLVEAQAYGCIPVSFNQGGQTDIVDHLSSGYISEFSLDPDEAALNLAKGIVWAVETIKNSEFYTKILNTMKDSVSSRFSYHQIVLQYKRLIQEIAI